jgi:hypothetical protein
MPDTFTDYKKQRFRWAYGSMQILRHHWRALLSPTNSALTAGQRYHYIAGWLPWMADGFNLLFNFAAIGWSIAMIIAPRKIDPPQMIFSILPLSLFTFKLVKLVHLYTHRVGVGIRQTFAAAFAGLALAHSIGRAILKGLVTKQEPFFRTPKMRDKHALLSAFSAAREEAFMMVALLTVAALIRMVPRELASPDLTVWLVALVIQSIPYAAAVAVSIASALNLPASLLHRVDPPASDPAPQT